MISGSFVKDPLPIGEDLSFPKKEKLCSHLLIRELVKNGTRCNSGLFRASYLLTRLPVNVPVQVLTVVPKSKLARAVDRNRMKRLMRESWRKNKALIFNVLSEEKKQMALMIVYQKSALSGTADVEKETHTLLRKIREKIAGPSHR